MTASTRNAHEAELGRLLGRCIEDFDLIEAGDRILVALSGGKDSYTLLHLLRRSQARAPVPFSLVAVHVDQGQPGYDGAPLRQWLEAEDYDFRIIQEDTYSIVTARVEPGKTYCALCARLRRGILYTVAKELGCNKIALGHHRDDAVETLLLNMSFNGSMAGMPARLQSPAHGLTVIRPLLYAAEAQIAAFATAMRFPILPCNLCGSQAGLMRQQVKALLTTLEARSPHVRANMLAAMGNLHLSHLLDRRYPAVTEHTPPAGKPSRRSLPVQP
ncbi:MAG: tRNA 2-thiocytidine(32) synthetase TtcA [Polyangiales bacterium]